MRLLFVVDVHDRFDAVVDTAVEVARSVGEIDVLVVGGDLTNAGAPDDATRAVELWRPLARTVLAVAGNMDSPAIDERLVELGVSIDGRGVVLGDVGIHGVSASGPTPLSTPHELPDETLGRRAEAGAVEVAGCRLRIFCPHSPPYGTACDRLASGVHVGSDALRAFVERDQPDLVLCGHIHESRGEDTVGSSRIVNPGPVAAGHYALVEAGDTLAVTLD